MSPQQTTNVDLISALLDSADVIMNLAAEAFCRSFQPHELLKVVKEYAPKVGRAKGTLYEKADAALRALVNAGVNYADADQRVKIIVGICNSFLEWACRFIGQAPAMPNPEKEPSDPESLPEWTRRQARLVKEQQAFSSAYQAARGDLLRMWQVMANQTARLQPPPSDQSPCPIPNERTEQPIIDALFQMKAIGIDALKAIPKDKRPTGELLAPKAIGRSCDGQFKTTLAHMVDLGWLGNGRAHGLAGGYFLTAAGAALATKRR